MITGDRRQPKLKVCEEIDSLVPYPPGKPIEELERELGITGSIKLASNENPLGPSPKAVRAVSDALRGLNRYPDGSCFYLKERLSKKLGVDPASLIFGNGSNEIIELLIRAFLSGGEAVFAAPSFAVYPIAVQAACGVGVCVPLKGYTHDLTAMARAVTEKTRLVFIANPNNPTGTVVTASDFFAFIDDLPEDVIVCVDEAYYEFVRNKAYPRTLDYINEGKNVILLRTFSKVYGLAGLRIGYGVAHPTMISYLDRVRQPFNVNTLAQVAALAAVEDSEHLAATLENNAAGLEYLFTEVRAMGLECVETEANFFMVKVGDGKVVYEELLKEGVIVRPMASYSMPEFIRVTVGTPDENRRFVEALGTAVS